MATEEDLIKDSPESIQYLHRINIYMKYLETDKYKSQRELFEKELIHLNRNLLGELSDYNATQDDPNDSVRQRIISKFLSESEIIKNNLFQASHVHHEIHFGINKFLIKNYNSARYEQFPLTYSGNEDIPLTLTLQFDLTRGFHDQAVKAKVKFHDAIQLLNDDLSNSTNIQASSRRTFQDISKCMSVYLKRQSDMKNKYTWNATSRNLNLTVSTARYRYKVAKELIESGEIAKYFPRFI